MSTIENSRQILTNLQDGVLHLQLNRPEKRNALTQAMYGGLGEAISRADKNGSVRVIFLTGSKDYFCAGNDLKDFQKASNRTDDQRSQGSLFATAMMATNKPIVAAVAGMAIGIGTTMLLHCDLVYCSKSAQFSMPFINLGLCPEFGSSMLLPMMAGHQRAAELLLLGEVFDAKKAQEVGIVSEIFPDHQLMEEAMKKAKKLAAKPPSAVRLTKSLMKLANKEAVKEFMRIEGGHFKDRLTSPEAREAFAAFFEKRKPDFSRFE